MELSMELRFKINFSCMKFIPVCQIKDHSKNFIYEMLLKIAEPNY
jgi:hypothetical protein